MEFKEFQSRAGQTNQFRDPERSLASSVWNLNETVGILSRIYDERSRIPSPEHDKRLQDKIGDVLWYVSNICTCLNVELDLVAKGNLDKCDSRWGDKSHARTFYDADCPKDEQFPRTMTLRVRETKTGTAKIERRCGEKEWMQIGARVTDNAYSDDGYRFHDVIHLAYVAVLGWSPVIRALLLLKRKSNPKVDEIEDGARAINLEEALTALVHEFAKANHYFEGQKWVPFELLKLIERLTQGLEVNSATYELWNQAIIEGYKIWLQVKAGNGGLIKYDMTARTLSFASLGAELP